MNDHTAEVRSSRNLRRGAHQLLELYRGHWGQLFWAAFWFTVKHSPAWVTPIVIANIINIVTDPEHHNLTQFWLNLIVGSVFIAQNVLTAWLHTRASSGLTRGVEMELRGAMVHLDIVYPLIGGIPLAKLLPMTLEEMCEELRKRPGRGGNCIKETTVQKYLETVSSVLEDAKKNDIIPFNPAHRVRKKHFEKEVQHIPQKYEMGKLMRAIQNEPILYRAYYTLAITTGLRRGELCALQWRDITGACELTVRRSRSCASGQIVESDTKSHRERIVTIPMGIWELLMALRQQQVLHSGVPDREQPIFTDPDGHVPHPDSFTRHLRKLYKKCGLPEEYHVHSLRHTNASLLIAQGVDVRTVASLLGHAQASTTLDIYAHAFDKNKRKAQEKLGKAIGL